MELVFKHFLFLSKFVFNFSKLENFALISGTLTRPSLLLSKDSLDATQNLERKYRGKVAIL